MNNITVNTSCTQRDWRKTAKRLGIILITLGGFSFSYSALAACTITGNITQPSNYHTATELEINSSAAIGEELGRFSFETNRINGSSSVTCTDEQPILTLTSYYPIESPGIYQTGIPGIGMKIIEIVNFGSLPSTAIKDENPYEISTYFKYILTFIKTGYIASGGQLPAGPFAHAYMENAGNLTAYTGILSAPLTLKLLRPTCTVNTPNFTVDLGEVSIGDFNTSGRTLPKNFSLDLACTGGTQSADVHVTLTDANNPGNMTSQLGLSPDSSAQGIALEVNNKFGAVTFGPDLEGIGNPGQWLEGAAGVGSFSIPLSVNYVRLPGPIKGGTANSGVTYTLNYDYPSKEVYESERLMNLFYCRKAPVPKAMGKPSWFTDKWLLIYSLFYSPEAQ